MKKIYLLLIFLIPLFITACASPGFLSRSGSSSYGPNGIQIKFLQPNQAFTINEGEEITVLLEWTNFAQCDAIGKICIDDGALSEAFGGFNKKRDCNQFNLPGAVEEKGKLSYDSMEHSFTSQPYQNLFADTTISINAIANYRCDVTMSPTVCVRSPADRTSTCKLSEVISGNSLAAKAAPVTLVQIDKSTGEESGNLKLKTALTLKKMSKGLVRDEEGNTKMLVEANYGGLSMDCGKNTKDYENGILIWKPNEPEKIINCEILLAREEISSPLTIHLDYNYEISEEIRQIKIKAEEEVA
ncbi:MAG: hypothetical protein AABX55_02305 [Nanoarchaeota archaeon]